MKKLGLYLMSVLVVCLSFLFAACTPEDGQDTVTLNQTAITLEVGESQTLTATSNVESVEWSTSNAAIATVNGGVVTAVAAGTATITATAGTASATCTVTVNEAEEYAELTIDKTLVELRQGGASVSVTATFTVNDEAFNCDFVWTSENEAIATVENGSITPVGVGSTVVTVSVQYKGETYAADVNVAVKPDEQIQVSKGVIELALVAMNGDIVSDTFTATAYKSGVEITDATFTFASSNENVATVSVEGNVATVTSVGEGTCTISVSYTSENGKIETLVEVSVARSRIVLGEIVEVPYVENGTVLDASGLDVEGEFESVYYADEKVAAEDGVFDATFVERNKGVIIPVEIRTSSAVYEVELLIAIPYVAEPKQEQAGTLVDMPTFDGDAETLGFSAGTETVYEIVIDAANGKDGWTNRMIINAAADKDVVVFDVIVKEGMVFDRFTMWPAMNVVETQGSYGVTAKASDSSAEADSERKIFILGTDGKQPSGLQAETLYTVYFFINKGESHVHFSIFTDGTVYVANIRCLEADEIVNDPTLPPPPISQGEDRNPMPTYDGDVTQLGFAADTTVYEIVGPQGNPDDVKLVATVDASGDNAYAKLDFVLSADTTSLGLWITGVNSHLGYYTITPTGFTADGLGNPSRDIFVTDANGERISAFTANTMYTLYVGLDGREATVQFTTWAALTIYVANIECITVNELPNGITPPSVPQGKEISILFIGNSFSDDTEAYMVDILLDLGYTSIDIGNLYIGGCSINTHYENMLSGALAYDFRMKSHNGSKFTEYAPVSVGGKKQSLDFAIAYKDWDIISIQQASGDSGKPDTYANLDALMSEVASRATNPDVQFVFNMTWAYQADSTHAQFPDYNSDQMTMYNAIVNAVQTKVDYTVIPNGTAIQNARTSFIGDNLTRDGYHLNLQIGRFIAGLTFVAKVTGMDITDFAYAPAGVTEEELAVAIESVQNAIKTPFAVTQSLVAGPQDLYIYQGIDNTNRLPIFKGDVTTLGFNAGEFVQEMYTIATNDPWGQDANGKTRENLSARIPMDVDKTWVTVRFAVSSNFSTGNLFFAWGTNADGSAAAFTYVSIAGANSGGFIAKIVDKDGKPVTELTANTVYTLVMSKPQTNVFKLANMVKAEMSVYFAASSVTYYDEDPYYVETPDIVSGEATSTALSVYEGSVTDLGFAEGTTVYQLVSAHSWNDRVKIAADNDYKYLDVQFIVKEGPWYFTVWVCNASGMLDGSYNVAELGGGVQHATFGEGFAIHAPNQGTAGGNTKIQVFDANGNLVIGGRTNGSIYTLRVWLKNESVTEIQIGQSNVTMYFANVECTNEEMQSTETPDVPVVPSEPDDDAVITAGGTNKNAVSKFDGDETTLGFAADSEVYQYVGTDSSTDKLAIKADSANYDYVEFEFVIANGDGYFFAFVAKNGSFLNGGDSYVIDPSNLRRASGNAMDRNIQIFTANGEVATTLLRTNTLYKMRVFIKAGEVDQVMIGKSGSTIYVANVTHGLQSDLPVEGPIKQGDGQATLPTYTGDETALGFEEGTFLQYMVTETLTGGWWEQTSVDSNGKTREQLSARIVGEKGKYVTIQFATSQDIASGSVFYVWGLLGKTHTQDEGVNFVTTTYGRILDKNGYPVSSISKNTVYVLELYIEGTDTYKVANICATGMELYFAPDSLTVSDKSIAVQLPGSDSLVTAGGSNKNAVTVYTGDETALGFEEGSTVYKYVGETNNDKVSIKVDSVNYDYVDIQMVFDEVSAKTWFLGFVMSGSSYLNGADGYILAGDGVRFNANAGNALDRTIQFLDAEGNVVNTALQKGVVYTLRIYVKANNVTEIQMRQTGVTAYFANVTYGVEKA